MYLRLKTHVSTNCEWVRRESCYRASQCILLTLLQGTIIACDPSAPGQSYSLPTAIIGIPVESADEADRIRGAIGEFASQHGMDLHRRRDSPFFRQSCSQIPGSCPDIYQPRVLLPREGFGVMLHEFSEKCFVIQLMEYSPAWTRRSLRALKNLEDRLKVATHSKARLLVRPKSSQNWPEQNRPRQGPDPERPTYLEDLCPRLGVPNRREPRNGQSLNGQ